jgi:mannose-6-phosphate isomerase-like protein (cupin superfamily)
MDPVVHRPGEGERLEVGPSSLILHATSADTDGKFFLSESTIAPGFPGPPPHTHETLHDMFFVLEGTLTMLLRDETLEAGPGTFVCVPPGTVHTFSNTSDAPVRILNFNAPGGFEEYMRELAESGKNGPPSREEIGKIASRYDFKPA